MRVGSLCSGIGGIELGLSMVEPVEVAWHSEIDVAACRVLDAHWPGMANLGDLRAVDWTTVEPVDLLTAGYPCQPFSHAGRRGGTDDPRHLWPAVADAVRVLRPRLVLLENVAGHLSLGFGRVLGDLAEAGFDAEWCCVRSSDVGAPHRRERIFVLASPHTAAVAAGEGRRQPRGAGQAISGPGEVEQPRRRAARVGGWATPDADGERLKGRAQHHGEPQPGRLGERQPRVDAYGRVLEWGRYRRAVDQWGHLLGRDAPDPTCEGKLSPAFVEWMLGYPPGWTEPAGSRNARLRCLGNSVQPQVAALAWRTLTGAAP